MNTYLFYHSPNTRNSSARERKKGRVTIAALVEEDGTVKFGAAKCSPKDNFSRSIGRHIAINRAANSDKAIAVTEVPHDLDLIQWFRDTAYLLSLEVLAGQLKPTGTP